MSIEKCPACKREIETNHGKNARSYFCPKCKKRIQLGFTGKNLTPDKNGVLHKKYKPKK